MSNRTTPLAMVVARLKRWCAAALLLIALAGIHPTGVQAAPIISAPLVTVAVGDLITIPISITDAVDLTLWQFDLAFDPTIVQAGVVNEGTFMRTSGRRSSVLALPTTRAG